MGSVMEECLFERGVGSESAPASDGIRIRGGKRFVELPSRRQMSLEIRCVDNMVAPDAYVRVLD